ncbi:MAG: ribosome biogenesis GTP-binding protein YihA/YsxC [Gammaproteobacteria bacterium]|nr:ribosome biogenesis GTP-binding protein YihA/YsxC [Gammaproteobacteria bacterium]
MSSLHDAAFVAGAARLVDLPADYGREVAFTGRSNAGKSSALNRLTGQTHLARVSKTPGRTQQLNVFALDGGHRLIDLPGYGYAKVPEALRRRFAGLLEGYLRGRQSLCGLVLLADIRQGLKDEDRNLIGARTDIPILILLSKADKLGRGAQKAGVLAVAKAVPENCYVLPFSAHTGDGVDEARARVEAFLRDRDT